MMASLDEDLERYTLDPIEKKYRQECQLYYRCKTLDEHYRSKMDAALEQDRPIFCRISVDTFLQNHMDMGLRVRGLYQCLVETDKTDEQGRSIADFRYMLTGSYETLKCKE